MVGRLKIGMKFRVGRMREIPGRIRLGSCERRQGSREKSA